MLKLRPLFKPHIKHVVGSGETLFLVWWMASIWDLDWKILSESFIALGDKATIADVIKANDWRWPLARSVDLLRITDWFVRVGCSNHWLCKVVFTGPSGGSFPRKEAWKPGRWCGNKVTWHWLVWFWPNVPEYGFTTWLAIHNRLHTLDRMKIWCSMHSTSVLCRQHEESRIYLFFKGVFCVLKADLGTSYTATLMS